MISAEARKEAASTESASREPVTATSKPPNAGPSATCRLNAVLIRAFADISSSRSTSEGIALLLAAENVRDSSVATPTSARMPA